MEPFRLDPRTVAWRTIGGCALLVSRKTGDLHHLNRLATEIWQALATARTPLDAGELQAAIASAPSVATKDIEVFLVELERAGLVEGAGRSSELSRRPGKPTVLSPTRISSPPRRRRIANTWELVEEIEPMPNVLVRSVGGGFLVRSHDGTLCVLASEAAHVWDLLCCGARTFIEILDGLCDRFGASYEEAESIALPLLRSLHHQGAIRGLEHVPQLRAGGWDPDAPSAGPGIGFFAAGARSLGRLELMRLSAGRVAPPSPGESLIVRDISGPIEHVAVVCQYGIHGVVPGTGPYIQRCIARLRQLDVDLIILAGGGRHGHADTREAESVVDWYRAQLPEAALWVEKHSATTWENLKHSLEMLLARSIIPGRVSFMGDRARTEKLRLSCWLARRRFAPFRDVSFRVISLVRPPVTWRDRRAIQAFVGSTQVFKESRGAALASIPTPSA